MAQLTAKTEAVPLPSFSMPKTKIRFADKKLGEITLSPTQNVTIGRHPDNDICLGKDTVASRFHCVIEPGPRGTFVLKDLGSRNGTHVNGRGISTAELKGGDTVQVGKQTFVVDIEAEPKTRKRIPLSAQTGKLAPWAADLRNTIDDIPPKSSDDEHIVLINADDTPSSALESAADGSQAVKMLLLLASKGRATDIHLEPKREYVSIRVRVDGGMVHVIDLPSEIGERTMGVIKTACQMKQAARDAVLDGHFGADFDNRRVDFRASFTPTVHGQKLVIRILDGRTAPQSISELAMPPFVEQRIVQLCDQNAGMLLACGPTGSGKTTTLYNCLRTIDRTVRNVVTIEDPVEYQLDNTTQIPVSDRQSFGDLLRSVLRQDPDVILVGEIRDDETARTAMQAAMTGHLVFSTVHAKDSISAVFRLLDLKVEPYLVANSVNVIIAQRLVRLLCPHCKRDVRVTPGQATRLGRYLRDQDHTYTATGCRRCLKTGYMGRKAIFEMLDFNDELRDCVLGNPSIQAMRRIVEQGVFRTLQQAGWLLAAEGDTSLDEVDRVAGIGG